MLLSEKNKDLVPSELLFFLIPEKVFWFLLLILLNDFKNLFLFYINIDIDEVLLVDKNKALGSIPLAFFPFVILE